MSAAFLSPADLTEAARALEVRQTELLAGGTDVVDRLRHGTAAPTRLVRIARMLPRDIRRANEGVTFGAGATLAALVRSPETQRYRALVEACAHTATPQIREAATAGGALRQKQRCGYFRHPALTCLQKGGSRCLAREGDASAHAIFDNDSMCIATHASTLACALIALDGTLEVTVPESTRTLTAAEVFTVDPQRSMAFDALAAHAVFTRITLPAPPTHSAYVRASARALADWADVEVAGAVWRGGSAATDVRLCLGGVARTPRLAVSAQRAFLAGASAEDVARAAVLGAHPYPGAEHKVTLLAGAVRVLVDELRGSPR